MVDILPAWNPHVNIKLEESQCLKTATVCKPLSQHYASSQT